MALKGLTKARRKVSRFREERRKKGLRGEERERRLSYIKTKHLGEKETSEQQLAGQRAREAEARRELGLGRQARKVAKRKIKVETLAARAAAEKQMAQQSQRESEARKELKRAKAARRLAEAQRYGSYLPHVKMPSAQSIAYAPAKILSFPLKVVGTQMPQMLAGSAQRRPTPKRTSRDLNSDIFGTGIPLV